MLTPVNTGSTPGAGAVNSTDVEAVLAGMEPGKPYKFDDLFVYYRSVSMAAGREPGHSIPFSKALTARDDMKRGRVYESGTRRQVRVYTRTS